MKYETRKIFPDPDDIFKRLRLYTSGKGKGSDPGDRIPYHNDGQAHGLCFSVKPDVDVPPSLVNIYQELHDDLAAMCRTTDI